MDRRQFLAACGAIAAGASNASAVTAWRVGVPDPTKDRAIFVLAFVDERRDVLAMGSVFIKGKAVGYMVRTEPVDVDIIATGTVRAVLIGTPQGGAVTLPAMQRGDDRAPPPNSIVFTTLQVVAGERLSVAPLEIRI